EPPGLRTVLHLRFDAIQQKLSEGLEGGIADLADIFHPYTVGQNIDPKVAEHLALVREKARIAALARLERENIVADETLQPFDTILADDPDLAAVREVRESDGLAHRLIFRLPLSIVSRHLPPGDFFKDCPEFQVLFVKKGVLHSKSVRCETLDMRRKAVFH